jgi:regulatory protein
MKFKDALIKARFFCAQQERSKFEIKRKLEAWGAERADFEAIISKLEKDNFINDQRFADLFAMSKTNQKKWGRLKIRYELKKHEIKQNTIDEAISKIELNKIIENLDTLAGKKIKELSGRNAPNRYEKLKRFLYSKGYEPELIIKYFNNHKI